MATRRAEFWTHAALTRRYRPLCRMVRRVWTAAERPTNPRSATVGTRLQYEPAARGVSDPGCHRGLSAQAERMLTLEARAT